MHPLSFLSGAIPFLCKEPNLVSLPSRQQKRNKRYHLQQDLSKSSGNSCGQAWPVSGPAPRRLPR